MSHNMVSVIIPTYQALEHLKMTIRSLEKQKIDPHRFEVIVIDDGSDDQTELWLTQYNGRVDLKPIIFKENKGRSAARNAGAALAANPILIFLDGDMELGPDYVSHHAKWHTDPNLIIVGRVIYQADLRKHGYARYLEKRGAMKFKRGVRIPGRYFLSGNSSMSKETFANVEGFSESIRHYGEDLDLGIRLEKAGMTLKYDPDLVVSHLHIRSFTQALRTAYEYGFQSLPGLVNTHLELKSQLHLDWFEGNNIAVIFKRMILTGPVYFPLLAINSVLNEFAAPAFLYSYLIFRNYFCGYRDRVRSNLHND